MKKNRMILSVAVVAFLAVSLVVALTQTVGSGPATAEDTANVSPTPAHVGAAPTPNAPPPAESEKDQGKPRLVAYYFHATQRCVTCLQIEEYAKDVMQEYFRQELQDGRLEFRPIDVQKPENNHYIRDYQLRFQSLILAQYRGEQQIDWKNLVKVWEYVWDQDKFYSYVRAEVDAMLEELN